MLLRIRRKKCDEIKPACLQCVDTGRRCDFSSFTPQSLTGLKLGCGPLLDFEVLYFEYFRAVCVPEFSFYFQDALWGEILLQASRS
jgi:hypothetical protein